MQSQMSKEVFNLSGVTEAPQLVCGALVFQKLQDCWSSAGYRTKANEIVRKIGWKHEGAFSEGTVRRLGHAPMILPV
ncbi:hypothetical protein DBR23_08385 [Acidovorax sp. HMWF018]|nr:hypothetical protein DBR23_08385 [Acidovorax sp. HMWF018]